MAPCYYDALGRPLDDAWLRAAVPVPGHGTVTDRCRILLCDADPQSLHALRVVLHHAGFDVVRPAPQQRRSVAAVCACPGPRSSSSRYLTAMA
jgi:hypothetical protein